VIDPFTSGRTVVGRAPELVRQRLEGLAEPVTVLGRFPTAVYLQLPDGSVFAVLNADAVALPIGIVVALPTSRLDLSAVGSDGASRASVRAGVVRLGSLAVETSGHRDTTLRRCGRPASLLIEQACHALEGLAESRGLPRQILTSLAGAFSVGVLGAAGITACVKRLLGYGPGLTPAGDDVLCGILAGRALFGPSRAGELLARSVASALARRPRATTSLSQELLRAALDGQGIEQLSRLARALSRPEGASRLPDALERIAAVGHTSGVALGIGLLVAAHTSVTERSGG
jgi:hypothetical protein